MNKSGYTNEDFFKVFGHISILFATLDLLVTFFIARLVDFSKTKKCPINERTTLRQKFLIIKELKPNQVFDEDILKQINAGIDNALEVSEMRNRFIHDQWIFDPNFIKDGKIERVTITEIERGSLVTVRETHTYQELDKFKDRIGFLQIVVSDLTDKLSQENQIKNSMYLKGLDE